MNQGLIDVDDYQLYDHYFGTRPFCAIVYVNLEHFKEKFNFDMTDWLHRYMPLLSIDLPYSPEVVRMFYHNMYVQEKANKSDDDVLITKVRDQEIKITAHDLNVILGAVNVPEDPPKLSHLECHQILFPDAPIEGKSINVTPAQMKSEYRVLWYVYSRCLVQKGQSFTHFVRRDFERFASLIAMEERDLGKWIMEEMMSFLSTAKVRLRATIPYPSLVSRILEVNNIWYLSDDKAVYPALFGKEHMKSMQISFTKATSKGKGKEPVSSSQPSGSKPGPSVPHPQDEADSSKAGPSSAPAPSFAQAATQAIVEAAIQKAMTPVKNAFDVYAELVRKMIQSFTKDMEVLHYKLGMSVDTALEDFKRELDQRFSVLYDQQQSFKTEVEAVVQQNKHFDLTLDTFAMSLGLDRPPPPPPPEKPPSTAPPPPPPEQPASRSPSPVADPVVAAAIIDPSTVPEGSTTSPPAQ